MYIYMYVRELCVCDDWERERENKTNKLVNKRRNDGYVHMYICLNE